MTNFNERVGRVIKIRLFKCIYQTTILLTLFYFVFLVKIKTLKSLSIFNTKAFQSFDFSSKILRKKVSIEL